MTKIDHLTESERQRILVDWNQTVVRWRPDACIHELFAEQAATRPNAPAVRAGDTTAG